MENIPQENSTHPEDKEKALKSNLERLKSQMEEAGEVNTQKYIEVVKKLEDLNDTNA